MPRLLEGRTPRGVLVLALIVLAACSRRTEYEVRSAVRGGKSMITKGRLYVASDIVGVRLEVAAAAASQRLDVELVITNSSGSELDVRAFGISVTDAAGNALGRSTLKVDGSRDAPGKLVLQAGQSSHVLASFGFANRSDMERIVVTHSGFSRAGREVPVSVTMHAR